MTNKEFKAKKQDIANHIEHSFRLDGNPKMDNTHKYIIKSIDAQTLVSMISELQPPPPPTCATCDYCLSDDEEFNLHCNNSGVAGNPARDDFGCLNHSDYGAAK